MNATDELRRMLDKRGVEYTANERDTQWWPKNNPAGVLAENSRYPHGTLDVYGLTPEQTVAATLGRGTCHECAGMDDVFECSACGGRYEGWALKRWARYCPNCGRRIEVDK